MENVFKRTQETQFFHTPAYEFSGNFPAPYLLDFEKNTLPRLFQPPSIRQKEYYVMLAVSFFQTPCLTVFHKIYFIFRAFLFYSISISLYIQT